MRFAKAAWPFVAPFALIAALLALLGQPAWAAVAAAAAVAVLLFFRDPERSFAGDEDLVLAAADGRVTSVDTVSDPEVGGESRRVVTFLSAFNVHIQRAPVPGRVVHSSYRPGRKVAAFRADADQVNEWQLTVLRHPSGELYGVRQIAGLIARRVVPYLTTEDVVARGERLGLIKFGSRVDVLLPRECELLVRPGDKLRAGTTPIARRPPQHRDSHTSEAHPADGPTP